MLSTNKSRGSKNGRYISYIAVNVDDSKDFNRILKELERRMEFSVIEDDKDPVGKNVLFIFQNTRPNKWKPWCEYIVMDGTFEDAIPATKLFDMLLETLPVNEKMSVSNWLFKLEKMGVTLKEDKDILPVIAIKEYQRLEETYDNGPIEATDEVFNKLVKDQYVMGENINDYIALLKHKLGIERMDNEGLFGEYSIIKCPQCGRYTLNAHEICACGYEDGNDNFAIEETYNELVAEK